MTIDANIVIGYLGGEAKVIQVLSDWKKEGRVLLLPAMVEAEVLSFSKLSPSEISTIEDFLQDNFILVPMDRLIAKRAAMLRRTYPIKLPDAIIAATALQTNTPLVTRNVRDFEKIRGISLISNI